MKKRYYRIDNGDTPVINADLSTLMEILISEADSYRTEEVTDNDKPEWTIDLIWLTDEEYENLPEA
jgi:hypothetical protein